MCHRIFHGPSLIRRIRLRSWRNFFERRLDIRRIDFCAIDMTRRIVSPSQKRQGVPSITVDYRSRIHSRKSHRSAIHQSPFNIAETRIAKRADNRDLWLCYMHVIYYVTLSFITSNLSSAKISRQRSEIKITPKERRGFCRIRGEKIYK